MISKIGVALTLVLLTTVIQVLGENPQNTKSAAKGATVLEFQMEGTEARELRDSSSFANHARGYGEPLDRVFKRVERPDGGKALRLGSETYAPTNCWGFIPHSASLEAKKMSISFDIHPDEVIQIPGGRGVNLLSAQAHVAHYRKPKTMERPPYHKALRMALRKNNKIFLNLALKGADGKIKNHQFTAKTPLADGKTTKVEWIIGENKVDLLFDGKNVQSWPKKGEIVYDHPDFYPGNIAWQFGSGRFKGWLDNFKIVDLEMKKAVSVAIKLKTDRDLNFFTQKEPKIIQAGVENFTDKAITGTLKYKSVDYLGKTICEKDKKLTLKLGQNNPVALEIPSEKRGCFWLKCIFEADGKTLASREINYAVGAIRDVSDHPDSSPFGLQASHRYRCKIPDIGMKWVRLIPARMYLEPKEGEYNWDRMDEVLDRMAKEGRKVMACLYGMPVWAVTDEVRKEAEAKSKNKWRIRTFCRGYPPADWKKHEEFLRKLITRYKDKVDAWEVWNEANVDYWDGTVEEYVKLLNITHRLIREIDPNAIIVGPSICAASRDAWSGEVLSRGGAKMFDVFAAHYFGGGYGGIPRPEYVPGKARDIRGMLDEFGGQKIKIWDGECGYLTATRHGPDFRPLTEEQLDKRQEVKENFLTKHLSLNNTHNTACDDELEVSVATVRRLVLCLANKVEKTIVHPVGSWHYESDLLKGNRSKGTSVLLPSIAWATMVEKLVHADFMRRIELGADHLHAYLFKDRRNQRNIAVFWSANGRAKLAIDPDTKQIECFDIWGNPVQIEMKDPNRLNLTLSEVPFYLEDIGGNAKVLPGLMKVDFPNLMTPGKSSEVLITATNPTSSELRGKITVKAPASVTVEPSQLEVALKANEQMKKHFKLTLKADAKPEKLDFEIAFNASDPKFNELQSASARVVELPLPLTHVTDEIVIDGDPNDPGWSSVPAELIEREDQVVFGRPLCYGDPATIRREQEWWGPDDMSAKLKICQKDGCLYILAQVKDNVFTVNERVRHAYEGDCVEVFIDARPEDKQNQPGYGAGTHQLFFNPADEKVPKATFHWWGRSVTEKAKWPIKLASKRTKEGYVIEVAIPLDKERFPNLDLSKGGVIGFDIAIDDADGTEKRKTQSIWRGTADNCHDASKLGKLKIEASKTK